MSSRGQRSLKTAIELDRRTSTSPAWRGAHAGAAIRAGCGSASSERPGHLPSKVELKLVLAAEHGDAAARGQLIETFRPLIAGVARIYRGSAAVDTSELMQEGVVGLLKALERYDPRRGTPFWGYASWWVRESMQQLVAELTRPVVLSDRALRKLARIKDARRELAQIHKKEPSIAELAIRTGFTRKQVEDLTAVERVPRALDEPLGDGNELDGTVGDMLADPVAEEEYEQVDRAPEVDCLRLLPTELSERERKVLHARYGLDGDEQTLREIGSDLSLSAERVRQIEEAALEKLRKAASPVPVAPVAA